MIVCRKCGESKPKEAYYWRPEGSILTYSCKLCKNREDRERRQNNRERNQERRRELSARYRERHGDALRKYQREWARQARLKNIEKARTYGREKTREYKKRRPEVIAAINIRRYGRKKGGPTNKDTLGIKVILINQQGNKCAHCKAKFNRNVKPQLDHIQPLAKNGKHVDSNLQVLCASCNGRKQARDPLEFAQSEGRLF